MDQLPGEKIMCHRTEFRESCRKLVVSGKCGRWIGMSGVDPNTGQPVRPYDCVDNWAPILLVEVAQKVNQMAAAAESARNEAATNAGAIAGGLLAVAEGAMKRSGPDGGGSAVGSEVKDIRLDGVRALQRLAKPKTEAGI